MDKQKKKNKNKKKKNNQNSNNDKVTTSDDVVHENGTSDKIDAEDLDANKQDHRANAVQSSKSAQVEQSWLQEKVALEEAINQLQDEIGSHKEKQAALETEIADLQNEKESLMQKELDSAKAEQNWLQEKASLEETIKLLNHEIDLHKEKQAMLDVRIANMQSESEQLLLKEADSREAESKTWVQDKASLEERISKLCHEDDMHRKKQSSLEIKIAELQSEKESWLQKEACLEERISKLSEDKAALGLNQDRLEERLRQLERDNDSLVSKEKVSNEVISKLDGDITRLRLQVVDFEESKDRIFQENQKLVADIDSLQAKIIELEKVSSQNTPEEQAKHTSGNDDGLNSQIEAACALVEKLITENSELVEKVNELYIELERRKTANEFSLPVQSDRTPEVAEIGNVMDRSSSTIDTTFGESFSHPEAVVQSGRIGYDKMDIENGFIASNSNDESGEIVQIPLDENEIQSVESRDVDVTENSAVPFSDAPLIGAPFRLMSFVASYVSGSDLVENANPRR